MAEPDHLELHRRPLAARRLPSFQRLASALARAGVGPNTVSVLGMAAGVAAGLALAATSLWPAADRPFWLLGALLVQLRLLANLLDGMVAVAANRATRLGELYNEVPDRVSDAATLVGLGYGLGGSPWLGWLAALLAVLTAYVRAVGKAAGAGSDFGGPQAKPQRMFLVTIVALYLALAPASWHPAPGLPALTLALIAAGSALTALLRLRRIARRLRGLPA